ncbi:brachyurin-like [Chironomus tepperi]|uniref:brachyurin-like n=1 Tax=Chironomus tepperi TaxID=113505 RepID=UPI00391F7E7D
MKLLILAIFAVAVASAVENYDGPEYDPVDWSRVVPVYDLPGFWEGTVYEKLAPKSNPRSSRIVGGHEVVPHSHPYQVYLLLELLLGTSACGGSVISETVALTAAHCINTARRVTVVAGGHNIQQIEPSQQRRTVEAVNLRVHPEYSRINVLNDIGTIILDNPLTFNEFVQPSILEPPSSNTFVGFTSQATGWGRVADNAPTSPVLRVVNNVILANAICAETYGNVSINNATICIQTTGGRGVCNGDSGGPLTVVDGQRIQVGIASFVHSAGCESGFPHVFERVGAHLDWIRDNSA